MKKIQMVAEAQTQRFPNGDNPFKILSRLLEESGEVAWEINHYERNGICLEKLNSERKSELVAETYQVMIAICQLIQYFNLEDDFKNRIEEVFQEYIDKKYIDHRLLDMEDPAPGQQDPH